MVSLRIALVLCCVLACTVRAQTASEAGPSSLLWQSLQWRSIGPFRGGRVLAVSGVPREPRHFYFGAVNGGVWETRDAGRVWQPIFDSVPVGSVGALAVAPSNADIIYVGTGEADMRSDIAQGHGVFKSIDAGHTWHSLGLEDSQQIGRILVDPTNPDVVLVAALGHPYGANETRGVYRSADGGKTWQRTLYRDADTGAIDLATVASQPNVIYAALWQTRRPPWNVYPPSNGPGSGLYKSTDEGQTWTPLTEHGLPPKPGRIGLAISPSNPQRVFALIDAEGGGLYRSDDAASSWTRVSDDSRIWKRGWYFAGITVDPTNDNVVYVCNTAMYRSDDGGKRFLPVKGAPGGDDYHQLWIDPADPQRQILGVDQGAVVTLDGGASWTSWYNQPTGQFYHVVTDNRFPYWVYGAQQDSGAAGVPSRTDNIDGINLTQFREMTAGGESDNIAPDPDDPSIIFGGRVDKLDQRTGQTQSVDPTLAYPDLYRATWTLPLEFGTAGSHALYFANQRVFRTTNRGKHWEAISPDLSRENPTVPRNLDATTVAYDAPVGPRRGVVYSIGPSPLDEKLIWAGTDDGLVWLTRDGGAHWRNVTPTALSAWSKIGVIEPSHFDVDSAYIAVDRHRLDDPDPYIYRTHDGGATWNLITTGIADPGVINAVNVVREDPERRGLLYSGTEHGVYVSFNDGARWQALQQHLPWTSVRDLQVHGDDLVIATHGRGFWIMDDIAPLRSIAEDARSEVRLFPPAPAYRVHPTGFTGSPMPKDEPMASNPPPGAYIDYALDRTTESVSLSIYDSGGALVRRFDSRDKTTQTDLGKIEIAPEWVTEAAPLATGPGMHRYVWNLHYAPPVALASDDPTEVEDGVWASPGRYSLVLQVGGQRYRQELTVVPDPRVKLASTVYARQLALARHIEDARLRIAAALGEATKIHTAIEVARKNAEPANALELSAADQRLLSITDIAPSRPSPDAMGSAPKAVRGLRYLSSQFHHLARAVNGADTEPTPDVLRGYTIHLALLEGVLADWKQFKAADLPKLNTRLQSAGGAPIAP